MRPTGSASARAGGRPRRPFGTHALRSQIIDQLVVELDDRLVELDDDQVLVVARVPMMARPLPSRGTSANP